MKNSSHSHSAVCSPTSLTLHLLYPIPTHRRLNEYLPSTSPCALLCTKRQLSLASRIPSPSSSSSHASPVNSDNENKCIANENAKLLDGTRGLKPRPNTFEKQSLCCFQLITGMYFIKFGTVKKKSFSTQSVFKRHHTKPFPDWL